MSEGEDQNAAPPAFIVETRGPCTIIRFTRPRQRNTLSTATLIELDAAFSELASRADAHSIIFTGTEDVFASGANIKELAMLSSAEAVEFAARGQRLFRKIAEAPALTIAAVNGYCMGGALDLALSCRLRCASPGAIFAHPGARLGIITGWGGTQRLPRLVGAARAFEMLLTARRVSAEEALDIGLVNRLGDPVLECALEVARGAR
jgi:enoyl-CoA hydratase/carnithine racemase